MRADLTRMPLPNLLANKPFNYTSGSTATASTRSTTKEADLDYESSNAFRDHIKQKIHTSSSRRFVDTTNASYSRNNPELVNLGDQRSSKSRPIDLKLSPDFMFMSKSTYPSRPSSRSSIRNQSQNSVENFRTDVDDAGLLYNTTATPRKTSATANGLVTRRQRIFYDKNENNDNNNINNDEITTSTIINDDEDDQDEEHGDESRSRQNHQHRDNRSSLDQMRERNVVSRTSRNGDYEPSSTPSMPSRSRGGDYFESQTPRLKSGRLTSRNLEREDSFFREPPLDRELNRSNSRAGNRRLASLEGGSGYLKNSSLMNNGGYSDNKENKSAKNNNTLYHSARSTSPIKARRRLQDHHHDDDDDDDQDVADQLPTLSARDTFREPSSSRLRTTLVERRSNHDRRPELEPETRRPSSSRLKNRADFDDLNPPMPRAETRNRSDRNVFENESRLADPPVRKPVPMPRKHLASNEGPVEQQESSRRKDSMSYDLFAKRNSNDFGGAGPDFRPNDSQPIIRGNSGGRRYQPTASASAKSNRLLNLRQKNYDSNFN